MHLEGKSLADVAGFLVRTNLFYGTDPDTIDRWLNDRPGLPNAELVSRWHGISLHLKSLPRSTDLSQLTKAWLEDATEPLEFT